MRHRKRTIKLNKTASHKRCMFANMLKSLITHERIVTTLPKAKQLKRYADQMITLAKDDSLSHRRSAIAKLMIRYNPLSSKEKRAAKEGDTTSYNDDRLVINKLFTTLGPRFQRRSGGYTRIIKSGHRVGDNTQECVIEYLSN